MKEYVVDTHPMIWYLAGNSAISLPAKQAIANVIQEQARCYWEYVLAFDWIQAKW